MNQIKTFICLCCLQIIIGCGGGGGGSTNIPPVAVAGADRVVTAGEEVFLDGSASTDPDGDVVAYQWVQSAGSPVVLTGAGTVSASFSAPLTVVREDLVFRLTIQDGAGVTSSDVVTITLNIKPVADVGPDQFAYDSSVIVLTGTSTDNDGTIVSHQWTQTGGTDVSLDDLTMPTLSFIAPPTTESLTFSYTVTDNDGAQRSDSVSVHVSRVLFSDSFVFVNEALWLEGNDTLNTALWSGEGGELLQVNNVHINAYQESYRLGTYKYLNSNFFPERSSFRFSVDVIPRTNNNGAREGNDVGIMFPYSATTDSYFRLSMNARNGYTRLEKKEDGVFRTLGVNSIGYVDDRVINMTVEVNADTIVVSIDDDPVFALADAVIDPGTIALYCQDRASFDNVILSENSPQPMIVVSSPLAHSIALTPGEGSTLTAQAVVLNQPVGSSVAFSLDGGVEIAATGSGNPHSAQFFGVNQGKHEICAILKGLDNAELNRDVNSVVGVGGHYIVAIGDSITHGVGDENYFNNDSLDDRIVSSQGFVAPLNDLLTATTGLSHIIFNEGIGGDRSEQLDVDRIDSILERHPGADKLLLLIGSNDALAGKTEVNFDDHLRNIVNTALWDVDRVYVAHIPPIFQDPLVSNPVLIQDALINAYNARIETFANDQSDDNILIGPDLYQLFLNQPGTLYDPDGLHPNDAGYQAMAGAWHDSLISHEP